jgi:hypothetical protein
MDYKSNENKEVVVGELRRQTPASHDSRQLGLAAAAALQPPPLSPCAAGAPACRPLHPCIPTVAPSITSLPFTHCIPAQ